MPPPLRAAAAHGLTYRPFEAADFKFIEALYLSTRAEEVALAGWPEAMRTEFLVQQHRAQHHHYNTYYSAAERLIVVRGGEPVGRLYLDQWADQFRIVDVSLVPSSRGAGLGSAILRDVMDWASDLGKGVSIHVETFNPARRLYLRLGFAVAGDKGIYELMEWGMAVAPAATEPAGPGSIGTGEATRDDARRA